jgi:hypothetical protein
MCIKSLCANDMFSWFIERERSIASVSRVHQMSPLDGLFTYLLAGVLFHWVFRINLSWSLSLETNLNDFFCFNTNFEWKLTLLRCL